MITLSYFKLVAASPGCSNCETGRKLKLFSLEYLGTLNTSERFSQHVIVFIVSTNVKQKVENGNELEDLYQH